MSPAALDSTTPLRVGIAGLGTVGGGVVTLLHQNLALMAKRSGRPVIVTAVSVRNPARTENLPLEGVAQHASPLSLVERDDVDVVVELLGGADGLALDLVEAALLAGKPVVTANKALLATHGYDLAIKAEAAGLPLLWEAAVMAGVPVVKGIRHGAVGDRALALSGIMNGTCAYILSTMERTGRSFADVLNEAGSKGYLEADPSLDIDGWDAAHKLCLLSSLAFGIKPDMSAIKVSGISQATPSRIEAVRLEGKALRLVAKARFVPESDKVEQSVGLEEIDRNSLLGSLQGTQNALELHLEHAGTLNWIGAGAGGAATALGVLSDLSLLARGFKALRSDTPWSYPVFGIPALELDDGRGVAHAG